MHMRNTTKVCVVTIAVLGASSAIASAQTLIRSHDAPLFVEPGYGATIASVDDLNGDGLDEYFTAFDDEEAPAAARGSVHSGIDGGTLFDFPVTTGYVQLCKATALDDIDGDGVPDFAFSDPEYNGVINDGGVTHVVSGADALIIRSHFGQEVSDHCGVQLVNTGDLDGDSVSDYAVTYNGHRFFSNPNGKVIVYSGATCAELRTYVGEFSGDSYGSALANLGDLNGDGYDELAAESEAAHFDSGSIDILSGIDGALLHQIDGSWHDDHFAQRVYAADDLSGDGVNDFLITAPREYNNLPLKGGNLRAYSGSDYSLLWTLNLDTSNNRLGSSLCFIRDRNGDGVTDLLTTVDAFDEGPDPVEYSRGVLLVSGSDGVLLDPFYDIEGRSTHLLQTIGDCDGDGIPDFAAVHPYHVPDP